MKPATRKNNRYLRKNRIVKPSEIYNIYRNGKKIQNEWLSICYIREKKRELEDSRNLPKISEDNRLGILIKRKVFRSAVSRNTFKRIIREFFRCLENDFSSTHSFLVCAERPPKSCEKAFFKTEIENLFNKGAFS
jgi:ribonuclease P protein component